MLKVLSPDITHKTDVGGVALDLADADAVRAAFRTDDGRRRPAKPPGARLEGVTVQKMVRAEDGVEMILGIKKDPTFGTVVLAGMGGTAAEIYRRPGHRLPAAQRAAGPAHARRRCGCGRCSQGYRGRPAAAVDKLVETLVRLSYLAADFPEVAELDINPAPGHARRGHGPRRPDRRRPRRRRGPQAALRPPVAPALSRGVRPTDDACGTARPITLRPIKPEDEPLWLALLASCSRESIYSRFRYFFFWQSHEVASRYCYIDYDRELAIVAEVGEGTGPPARRRRPPRRRARPAGGRVRRARPGRLAGQGPGRAPHRLLPGHRPAVGRPRRSRPSPTTDNPRMIAVFEKRGFRIVNDLARPRSSRCRRTYSRSGKPATGAGLRAWRSKTTISFAPGLQEGRRAVEPLLRSDLPVPAEVVPVDPDDALLPAAHVEVGVADRLRSSNAPRKKLPGRSAGRAARTCSRLR
ncbi:MAG: acetate--CoA ligase family protein [Comamonadaceae bacterium]|nr:acetate--CoA ligase family protein [Comamonadaceae bacterium]